MPLTRHRGSPSCSETPLSRGRRCPSRARSHPTTRSQYALRTASKEARAAGLLASRFMMGQGSYTRANPEFVLLGRRGKGAPAINRGVRSEVLAPRGEHSAKPSDVHERIEALCGDVRRLELFAREPRAGWDAWGNEVACDVRLRVPS